MSAQLKKPEADALMGSERSFGLVFGTLFAVIGLLPLFKGEDLRWWASCLAASFLAVALLRPAVLRPLNVVWFKFGLLLGHIITPLVMGLLYVLTVLPIGLYLRATERDLLRLRPQAAMKSYWIEREDSGPVKGSMKRQF